MNWRTVEEVPGADAKKRRRPRSSSARALPFVWDFAYGGPAGDSNRERNGRVVARRLSVAKFFFYWNRQYEYYVLVGII